MSNIWEFLLQSMEVTLTAAIILILKWMFQDKLSPRWQYGIWAILAAKLILPAGIFGRYLSLDLAACLNVLKNNSESQIISQFSDIYGEISPSLGIPMVYGIPSSVSDWVFLAYIVGVAAFIVYYLWEYVHLRMILRKGWMPDSEAERKVNQVASQHNLKPCKIIIIDGIESAFICGFIKPVLVIPASQEETIDEKIILHELIHKAYFDGWQNGLWCLMRCIHWCNPVMQYVFNRIGNDMESLCDQRVLERINGEARREYGQILLNMTNRKYARAIGTTSVSNGGNNIKKRIEAIVRFKKYPKGMALVSVCICLLVASPVFGMTRQVLDFHEDFSWFSSEEVRLTKVRLQGCGTVAGALETYTKGLVRQNKFYLAASLPADQQGRITEIAENSPVDVRLDDFIVMNLTEQDHGSATADILLYRVNEESLAYRNGEYDGEFDQGWAEEVEAVTPPEDLPFDVTVLPVRVYKEKQRWVVASDGETINYQTASEPYWNYQSQIPARKTYETECDDGRIQLWEQSYHFIQRKTSKDMWGMFFDDSSNLSGEANPDNRFERHRLQYQVFYNHNESKSSKNVETIAISTRVLTKEQPEPDWSEDAYTLMQTSEETASGDGSAIRIATIEDSWNGEYLLNIGIFDSYSQKIIPEAKAYAIRVYINKLPSETMIIERGETDEQ